MPRKITTKPAAARTTNKSSTAAKSVKSLKSSKSTKPSAKTPLTPRAVYLASLGAAKRAKEQATKAYTVIARETGRMTGITSETSGRYGPVSATGASDAGRDGGLIAARLISFALHDKSASRVACSQA